MSFLMIINIIGYIHILYLFNKRLFVLVRKQNNSSKMNSMEHSSKEETNTNSYPQSPSMFRFASRSTSNASVNKPTDEQLLSILKVCARLALLFMIGAGCAFFMAIFAVIYAIFPNKIWIEIMYWFVSCPMLAVVSSTYFLTLKLRSGLYEMLCGRLDAQCIKCCEYCALNTVSDETKCVQFNQREAI